MSDQPPGLTHLGRCGLGLGLVVENVRSFEWISLPRITQGQGAAARARALAAETKRAEAEQQLPRLNTSEREDDLIRVRHQTK